MDEKEKESLLSRRVSEWLDGASKCEDTCYKCSTNLGWCMCESERLNKKGVKADVVRYLGKVAVFKLLENESVKDVAEKLAEIDVSDDNKRAK